MHALSPRTLHQATLPGSPTRPYTSRPSPYALRVLIVDDHPVIRACLRGLVEEHADMRVVGEAHDGEEAVVFTNCLHPDVVLMDVRLPRMGGIEAARRICRGPAAPAVIGLTVHWTPSLEADMLEAGAAGCLSKAEMLERLHQTILASRSLIESRPNHARVTPRPRR